MSIATLGSRFDELRDQLRRASVELRDLARGVHPTALQEGGLGSALRHAVASFPGDATVDIRTARRFDPDVERAVYFCLTEALQNAFKHGGDGIHVRLVLDGDESELRFAVSDDGPGFDPAAASVGTGLDNMVDRLGAVGGELTVSASIGGGTTDLRRGTDRPGSPCLPHPRTPASATSRHALASLAPRPPLAHCGAQH